jgi:peptide-methionine (S)-S-oxide reductase
MRLNWLPGICAALIVGIAVATTASSRAVVLPDPQVDDPLAATSSKLSMVVAGGCLWGIEEVYQHVRGVIDAVSGYSGGSAKTADYELVSTGTTGHAESVKVTYDPSKISYGQLLEIFFSVAHDPTQRGGQGPDRGPQYRSVIFFSGPRQQEIARTYIAQLTTARVFEDSITTQVVPLEAFYQAEAYHQDYAQNNPTQRYIVFNDRPKVDNLKKLFASIYR